MKLRSLQKYILSLLLILSSESLMAAYTCASIFSDAPQLPTLQNIFDRYQQTGKDLTGKAPYNEQLTVFQIMLLDKADPQTLIDYYHRPQFAEKTNERLRLLFARPLDLTKRTQLIAQLKKAQQLRTETGHWIKAFENARAGENNPFSMNQFRNFESSRAPRLDQNNISTYTDISHWQSAVQHTYQLARYKAPLSQDGLLEIIARLHGKKEISPWPGDHIINDYSINLMKQSDRDGNDMTDPTNVFPAGTAKKQLMEEFLDWLAASESSVHPIVLAAQARQRIVSIHPLPDGNGRLARIIGDYVLMRAGYPPATIAASKVGKNTSVALFPLKDFREQITPEDTFRITHEGVLESYQRMLEKPL